MWNTAFIRPLAFRAYFRPTLAWVMWLYVLRSLPAGTADVGTLAIPVVGVLSAWLQLGERPSTLEGIGILLILAALAALTLRGLLAERPSGHVSASVAGISSRPSA